MNTLLIEDDDYLRVEIMEYFERRNHKVIGCGTLLQAGRKVDELLALGEGIDAVVCDIRLPDGDGIDFFMRNGTRMPTTQWVLMSGGNDFEKLEAWAGEGVGMSAHQVVYKPVSLRVLLQLASTRIPA